MAGRLLELWLLIFRRISGVHDQEVTVRRPTPRPKRKAKPVPRKRSSVPVSSLTPIPSLESTPGLTPVYTAESIHVHSDTVVPSPEPSAVTVIRSKQIRKPIQTEAKPAPVKVRPPTPAPTPEPVRGPVPEPAQKSAPPPAPKSAPPPAPKSAPLPTPKSAPPPAPKSAPPPAAKSAPPPAAKSAPPPVVMAEPETAGMCRPAEEEGLYGWRASLFTYITGKDGKRRRVFKFFHKTQEQKKEERLEKEGKKHFARKTRSCPRRRRCGSCEDNGKPWGCGSWLEFTLIVSLSVILLLGSLGLCVFWVMYYRGGFAWNEDSTVQFNLHPVFMITFVVIGGFAIMLYRVCRCFDRLYVKLLHAMLHILSAPCVVLGLMAVFDYHKNSDPPIPDFYSLHSWMGAATISLFCLQFLVGLISFLGLRIWSDATASFRIKLIPIHAIFGLATFILAVVTCLTGLNHRAILTLGSFYPAGVEEGSIINILGSMLLIACILIPYIIARGRFRVCPNSEQPPAERPPGFKKWSKKKGENICVD